MTTPPLEGGLLGDWYTPAMRLEDEQRRAKEAEAEAQAAADAAALQSRLDVTDKLALRYLKKELTELRGKSRTTTRQKRDYAAYRAWCSEQGLPETAAQAIYEFLVTQSDRGLARVKRLHRSIAAVQASIGHGRAADDLINRALIQHMSEAKESK